jgi:hypothetical protein
MLTSNSASMGGNILNTSSSLKCVKCSENIYQALILFTEIIPVADAQKPTQYH